VVYLINHFRQSLLGRKLLLRTDHSALRWLRKTPEPIGQQGRWLEILEEFEFDICHRPGRQHGNADALSRKPCRQCGQCAEDTAVRKTAGEAVQQVDQPSMGPQRIAQLQRDDEEIAPIYRASKKSRTAPAWEEMLRCSQATKAYWTMWERLEMHEEVLYARRKSDAGQSSTPVLVAPKALREEIMRLVHAGFSGGHLGRRRTLDQVRRRANWIGWTKDVRGFVQGCSECAGYKRGQAPHQGELQSMSTGEP